MNQRKASGGQLDNKVYDGQSITDPLEIAKKFAQHFSSVYVQDDGDIPPPKTSP